MKISFVLVAVAILICLIAFPTTTVAKNLRFWPKPIEEWPHPSEISKNEMFMNTLHNFNYEDSKVWKCTYSNGSAPAISISPSTPFTPSTPSPSTPKTSPPPPTPSLPPPSPPPVAPSLPPPTPKKTPSPPPPATPSLPPPAPKKSPSPSTPSLPPPVPKKSPSPAQPSNPPPEHHHGHHHDQYQNPWEHIDTCMRNMGPTTRCRVQMEISFFTKMFQVTDYCCNLIVNMKNDCDDVIWGFFNDPFFVPLVRYTCHVSY